MIWKWADDCLLIIIKDSVNNKWSAKAKGSQSAVIPAELPLARGEQVLMRSSLRGSQPLDYETHPVRSLVVVVENEELLFSCEGGKILKPRKAAASATVSVQVMDANDPPTFHPGSFIVSEVDGAKPGIQLGTFNALDPDKTASQIRWEEGRGRVV